MEWRRRRFRCGFWPGDFTSVRSAFGDIMRYAELVCLQRGRTDQARCSGVMTLEDAAERILRLTMINHIRVIYAFRLLLRISIHITKFNVSSFNSATIYSMMVRCNCFGKPAPSLRHKCSTS